MSKPLNVLRIEASGRRQGSTSRLLLDDLVDTLASQREIDVTRRDLAAGVPHVDDAWIAANFTPAGDRTDEQKDALLFSDALVAELEAADAVLIGMPIYNFGVPAALKAWVDMIARARRTFRYTDDGPVGLLRDKQVFLVVTSGGVAVDSESDFATPYMRQALAFVGLTDVALVVADRQNLRGEQAISEARATIADLVDTGMPPAIPERAA